MARSSKFSGVSQERAQASTSGHSLSMIEYQAVSRLGPLTTSA